MTAARLIPQRQHSRQVKWLSTADNQVGSGQARSIVPADLASLRRYWEEFQNPDRGDQTGLSTRTKAETALGGP